MFPWAHQVHNPNGISIGSAVFAQLTAKCRRACRDIPFPLKISPFSGGPGPNLWFFGSTPSIYTDRFSRFYTAQGTSLYFTMDRAFPQKFSFPIDYLDPQLIGLHGSLGPPESTTQTAYRLVQPFSQGSRQHPYILQWAAPSPKIALTMEILTQYTTWFLEPTRAHSPNSIFNGPAIFCRRRYQKSCYNNSVQSYGHSMRRGSLPPVAGFWRCMSITPENFSKI